MRSCWPWGADVCGWNFSKGKFRGFPPPTPTPTTLNNNIFERKVYWRILGSVYDNEKENWKLLANKEIYASVKKPTIIETVRLSWLHWFGRVHRMEEKRIPKRVLYTNLRTTILRDRPRNRWQDEVREDGRIVVGGEGWQEKVHNREEWKKLLRTARNRHILHMPMEWISVLSEMYVLNTACLAEVVVLHLIRKKDLAIVVQCPKRIGILSLLEVSSYTMNTLFKNMMLQFNMQLPSTQLSFDIIITRHLEYMATCFDRHLGHLQASR